jgi:hypothetical protein
MFGDVGRGDYRLNPGSPALKLGFKTFELGRVGLLPDFPNQWQETRNYWDQFRIELECVS